MTSTTSGPLAALLAEVVKTGQRPSAEQIQALKLRSTGTQARLKLRHQISEVSRQLAAAVRAGTDAEDVDRFVTNALRRLGSETGDHHHDDALPGRGQQFSSPTDRAEALAAAKRLSGELRNSVGTYSPMTDEDLAHFHARDGVDPEKFRARVRKASERISRLASTGDHQGARQLSMELGHELAADLAPVVKPDPAEACRKPSGEYDPAKMASLIPR